MKRVVLWQLVMATFLALLFLIFVGKAAGLSSLFGGLCYALPSAFFALRLYVSTLKPQGTNPMTFFFGELIKIFLTIAMLFAVVKLYPDLHWAAFLISFVVVMKSYFILLLKNPRNPL